MERWRAIESSTPRAEVVAPSRALRAGVAHTRRRHALLHICRLRLSQRAAGGTHQLVANRYPYEYTFIVLLLMLGKISSRDGVALRSRAGDWVVKLRLPRSTHPMDDPISDSMWIRHRIALVCRCRSRRRCPGGQAACRTLGRCYF